MLDTTQLAPIVLFVYNRPWHAQQTLEALGRNPLAKESVLYIYADGAKVNANEKTLLEIEETRKVIKERQWCKEVHIIELEQNRGLAASILAGVTDIVQKYGKIIVLEDDIVTSPGFLQYMNEALNMYENADKVMHISGFLPVAIGAKKLPDTFFLRFMSCWGWATWSSAWDKLVLDVDYLNRTLPGLDDYKDFNLDGSINMFAQIESNYNKKIKTWAIFWYSTIFISKGLCLYPRISLVDNIGWDGSGENCGIDSDYKVELAEEMPVTKIEDLRENSRGRAYLKRFYIKNEKKYNTSLKQQLKNYLKETPFFRIYKKIVK